MPKKNCNFLLKMNGQNEKILNLRKTYLKLRIFKVLD